MEPHTYRGSCFCGAVAVEVQGPPVAAAICHCESCRKWHSAPLNTWAVWPDAMVKVVAGEDQISEFNKQGPEGPSRRVFCKRCGASVMNRKPAYKMTVVYATTLEGSAFVFEPTFHSFYGEGVLDMADGLPKFVDLPSQLGGSGQMLDEPARTCLRR